MSETAASKVKTQLFIGGEWRDAEGGRTLDVHNPATEEVLASVADASVADGEAALAAAAAAQADWAKTAPRDRSEMLRSAFELLTERADYFAELMTLEMGKPLAEAKGEVTYGSEFFRWFAEEAVRIHGRWMQAPAGGSRLLTIRKPVGPCLFLTPWNFPLAMGTRKIGPAVAAGCTMVVKPAELTPLTAVKLAEAFREAGLPDGIFTVVQGFAETGRLLTRHPGIRKVSLTGEASTGRAVAALLTA